MKIKRCKKCIMPETPGHIIIDENGICNICNDRESQKIESDKK